MAASRVWLQATATAQRSRPFPTHRIQTPDVIRHTKATPTADMTDDGRCPRGLEPG